MDDGKQDELKTPNFFIKFPPVRILYNFRNQQETQLTKVYFRSPDWSCQSSNPGFDVNGLTAFLDSSVDLPCTAGPAFILFLSKHEYLARMDFLIH